VNVGEAVIVIAAQSIGEPGTQLMRTFTSAARRRVQQQSTTFRSSMAVQYVCTT
jgi:hypothetical protein